MEKQVRRNYYRWLLYTVICVLFFALGAALVVTTNSIELGVAFIIIAIAFFIIALVRGYIFLYYLWKAVYFDRKGEITPRKAIGFLFIPFFNFYWVFVYNLGLIKRLKKIRSANGFSLYIPSRVVAVVWILLSNLLFYMHHFGIRAVVTGGIIVIVYGIVYYYFLMRTAERVELMRSSGELKGYTSEKREEVFHIHQEHEGLGGEMIRGRKLFNVAFWLMIATVSMIFLARRADVMGHTSLAIVLCFTLCILFILLYVYEGMLFYHLWYKATGDKGAASRAVGFLYIPFFNLYWHFAAYVGLSKKMRDKIAQERLPLRSPSKGFAITYAILWIVLLLFIASSWYYIILVYCISNFIKWLFYYQSMIVLESSDMKKGEMVNS